MDEGGFASSVRCLHFDKFTYNSISLNYFDFLIFKFYIIFMYSVALFITDIISSVISKPLLLFLNIFYIKKYSICLALSISFLCNWIE